MRNPRLANGPSACTQAIEGQNQSRWHRVFYEDPQVQGPLTCVCTTFVGLSWCLCPVVFLLSSVKAVPLTYGLAEPRAEVQVCDRPSAVPCKHFNLCSASELDPCHRLVEHIDST